eukprot:GHVN01098909.1.p2 GENE.GHVN01098909.1~~GHVN01098909.1.p2  ORF type:complete len:155 (-),score=51.42 GHVN01098909.1:917-1381(-)
MMQSRGSQPSSSTQLIPPQSVPPSPGGRVYQIQLEPTRHVSFDGSAEDNEDLNRKKSKKCCIFHKQREFGETDTESNDSDGGPSRARPVTKKKKTERCGGSEKEKERCCHGGESDTIGGDGDGGGEGGDKGENGKKGAGEGESGGDGKTGPPSD